MKGIAVRQSPEMTCGTQSRRGMAGTGSCSTIRMASVDGNPALIADVHTNPNDDPSSGLYPSRVLHAATGPAVPLFLIVDTDEGPTLYVGPAFSYFELVEEGYPPVRLTDEEWRGRLSADPYPAAPAWTTSFRVASDRQPAWLELPTE